MTSDSRSPAAVYDILHCIISHLDPDRYPNPSDPEGWSVRQALARLATTHTTFTQPSLSALWRSLPNDRALKHLLCVVGLATLEDPPKYRGVCPGLELCGTPEAPESSWGRFREYASLVQKIVVDPCIREWRGSYHAALVRDTLWCQVSFMFGYRPILPNLKVMRFASVDLFDPIDMGILYLCNQSVKELSIEYFTAIGDTANPARLKTVFEPCLSSTPNLERLSLMLPYPLFDLDSALQYHDRLRHLRVDTPVDSRCVASVASLLNLECLSICLVESVTTPVHFKSLRSLSISGSEYGLESIGSLIASMQAPCLRKLSLTSSNRHSHDLRTELSQCLHPLATGFPSLTAFNLTFSQSREFQRGYFGSRNPGGTLAELLEPLLSLRTLRDLSLDLRGPLVPYSTTDFCRIAEAWPDLETLTLGLERPPEMPAGRHLVEWRSSFRDLEPSRGHICGGSSGGTVQYADYDAFVSFARHCPRLHTLWIPLVKIDSLNVPTDVPGPSLSEGCPTGHGLRHLHVLEVVCPEAPGRDAESRRVDVFAEMMKQVFPLVAVHWSPQSFTIIYPA